MKKRRVWQMAAMGLVVLAALLMVPFVVNALGRAMFVTVDGADWSMSAGASGGVLTVWWSDFALFAEDDSLSLIDDSLDYGFAKWLSVGPVTVFSESSEGVSHWHSVMVYRDPAGFMGVTGGEVPWLALVAAVLAGAGLCWGLARVCGRERVPG